MDSQSSVQSDDRQLVMGSALYRQRREVMQEVSLHKWFASEKAGRDVGIDFALIDWTIKHRAAWELAHGHPHASA